MRESGPRLASALRVRCCLPESRASGYALADALGSSRSGSRVSPAGDGGGLQLRSDVDDHPVGADQHERRRLHRHGRRRPARVSTRRASLVLRGATDADASAPVLERLLADGFRGALDRGMGGLWSRFRGWTELSRRRPEVDGREARGGWVLVHRPAALVWSGPGRPCNALASRGSGRLGALAAAAPVAAITPRCARGSRGCTRAAARQAPLGLARNRRWPRSAGATHCPRGPSIRSSRQDHRLQPRRRRASRASGSAAEVRLGKHTSGSAGSPLAGGMPNQRSACARRCCSASPLPLARRATRGARRGSRICRGRLSRVHGRAGSGRQREFDGASGGAGSAGHGAGAGPPGVDGRGLRSVHLCGRNSSVVAAAKEGEPPRAMSRAAQSGRFVPSPEAGSATRHPKPRRLRRKTCPAAGSPRSLVLEA